jgi:1,4-dihydroxy-2-naphthoyl-CoA hydrolase
MYDLTVLKDYYTVKLHDTDAAGILFFANQFKMVHDIYERFLKQIGFGLAERFASRDFFLPIINAEADFSQPLTVGDTIEITLSVAEIGRTSFILKYNLTNLDGISVGSARTVHVTTDPETQKKIDLPESFRLKLEEIKQENG